MSCTKCNEVFELYNVPSKIYFMSEIDELMQKSKEFLNNLQMEVKDISSINYIEVDDAKTFFKNHIKLFTDTFNELECQNIKLHVQDENSEFNFQCILGAKTLQRYINLVEDKEFFEIVNNKSLTSYFQPILNASDKSIYGYEALIRGIKENGELMFPDVFFEKTTRNDMTFKVDRLCRETALKTAAQNKINTRLFINFIPTSIYDPEFCLKSTVQWANELGFDPKNIVFEVVETETVNDKEHLKKILTFYRDKGFQIALDDVGEGYSNLNTLISLRPNIIKVDRYIIQNIDQDELKQSVYSSLYSLAQENGIEVLAEGVETLAELETVEKIGVDYLQGYYFGRPNPEPQLFN